MTLRTRLPLGLLTIAVILLVPLLLATRSLGRLHDDARVLRDRDFAASLLIGRVRDGINDLRGLELRVLFIHDEKSRAVMMQQLANLGLMADSLQSFDLGTTRAEVRAALQKVQTGVELEHRYAAVKRDVLADTISKRYVEPAILSAEAAVVSAERTLRERVRLRVAAAASAAQNARTAAMAGLLFALLVAAVIAYRLIRSVQHPVQELERGMRMVADGDFEAKLAIMPSQEDEFGRLAASFEEMSQQLAELDKLKAEFVSVASHELKTPINVILGYTQLLQEELYGPLTEKQRSVADVLEKQTQTLSRLVKQLLDLTRFEAGAGRIDVRSVELRGFLHSLEEDFQVLADQRGIRFIVSVHDGVPETVHWDADRVNEVLGNLLSNAFKFTDRGGEVELAVLPTDHSVQMEVRDTGAGIPPDQLHRIFDKFFQADNQASAANRGTGLGLAIARQIVEAHHGTISCDSTPGVGTTFTIVLPDHTAGRHGTTSPARPTADVA